MNRKIILAIALLAMAAGTASAQSGAKSPLKIKQGSRFSYESTSNMEMTISVMGQEQGSNIKTTAATELTAETVDKKQIQWLVATPQIRMTMDSPMMEGASMDTTISGESQKYVTDLSGKLISAPASDDASQMQMMLGGSMMKSFSIWFAPTLPKGAQSGATWTDERRDTMEMQGVNIISTQNLKYTYDGITDTLGVKVARIRWASSAVRFEGSGSLQGNDVVVEGDGAVNGISYYSTKDGMLIASKSDTESNMRLGINAGGQEMVLPMVQNSSVSILRK